MTSPRCWNSCGAKPHRRSAGIPPRCTRPRQDTSMGPRVAVLGAGSWGTTFAKILADGGAEVVLWARRPELAREISESKRNSDYLPRINLPRSLQASADLEAVLD